MFLKFTNVTAVLSICVLTLSAVPAHAQNNISSTLDSQRVISQMSSIAQSKDQDILGSAIEVAPEENSGNILEVALPDIEIEVPSDISSPVTVQEASTEAVSIYRPYDSDSEKADVVGEGTVVNEGDTFSTITSVKDDGGLQIATIINSEDTTERFSYVLDVPEDANIFETHGGVLIEDADGNLIGGFTPPWALDSSGQKIHTHYEVNGNVLTQVVSHKDTLNVHYPVVADPVYRRGMIHTVVHERWAKGGWEVRLQVTALARWYQPFNPSYVVTEGLKDLREHHPRSMASATMAQQWECHVLGLPGTINIDLESYRRSWPGWRSGISSAVIKLRPSSACNW
ncbi:hypothetical protein E4U03_12305 [Rothia nasimurium]|uniref:Uncharacterized protein n=1 Tax=Rothia nasimurium TaxID=85336 RepID=A0A4Y9F090_9MICC|nr:hypothetical protein [Rothia nasimurium]MBF0809378.1 hypothetical protein [Rothia nasimurium]TFU19600.1 hypothetical protein E4U03_12305 [Rothia nasimurium]